MSSPSLTRNVTELSTSREVKIGCRRRPVRRLRCLRPTWRQVRQDREVHRTCLGPHHLHVHTKRVQRTLDEWRVHWRVYSFALLCFGAVDRARLQQHACHIERLHSDYSNIPGGGWWIIAVADVRMGSEHMEKLRRRAEQAYASNPESGFDPARLWDWVFALAARDRDFWTAHVKDRADQFTHRLKSKSDIIGLDAIAAAGEDGECRMDDKTNRKPLAQVLAPNFIPTNREV